MTVESHSKYGAIDEIIFIRITRGIIKERLHTETKDNCYLDF